MLDMLIKLHNSFILKDIEDIIQLY